MIFLGYAYNPKASEIVSELRTKFENLREKNKFLRSDRTINCYGHVTYEGYIIEGGEDLSEEDIMILITRGNIPFGADCFKNNGMYSCKVFTD